ncbi:MAG: thioredoxin [Candidatus Gastranaerophilaceae bacterium]|jgi:thioredoxin 1|nr:thioredoxin [Christensenellales bacterium]
MSTEAKHITESDFETEVLGADKPVLVDFWAPWCGPCRMVGPEVEAVAAEYAGRANVVKINVDEQPELAGRYGIMSIPTIIVFKNGEIAEQVVGAVNRGKLKEMLDRHIQQ